MVNYCNYLPYICILIFVVHFSILFYHHCHPTIVTVVQDCPLKDREFPLLIKLCIKPGLDLEELSKVGYDGICAYFDGQSKYNYTSVGWAGHAENGSYIGEVEGRTLI